MRNVGAWKRRRGEYGGGRRGGKRRGGYLVGVLLDLVLGRGAAGRGAVLGRHLLLRLVLLSGECDLLLR